MSDDLLRQLRILEGEFAGQPLVAQQEDLREINHIRARLGMPPVDSHLKAVGVAAVVEVKAEKRAEGGPDHTEARNIYQAYLKKVEELEPHRAYAEQVVQATSGPGQTPVRPLATLGTNGGPLLCDHCRKPIVLEGEPYHEMTADVAWQQNPFGNWTSWILGGMVVELQTNGTLRIYHGYVGQDPRDCCNVASWEGKKARAKFESGIRSEQFPKILAFIEHEFPDMPREEQHSLLNRILDTMCSYDPGFGVNRPGAAS